MATLHSDVAATKIATPWKISNWWKIFTLTPQPTPMLEVFPLNQIADVGAPRSKDPKLFGREIIFEEFQPM